MVDFFQNVKPTSWFVLFSGVIFLLSMLTILRLAFYENENSQYNSESPPSFFEDEKSSDSVVTKDNEFKKGLDFFLKPANNSINEGEDG